MTSSGSDCIPRPVAMKLSKALHCSSAIVVQQYSKILELMQGDEELGKILQFKCRLTDKEMLDMGHQPIEEEFEKKKPQKGLADYM